jgi:CheY-like chemotaxis protein
MMPRMKGTEATRRIRSLGFLGIMVAVTGNVLDDDVADFLSHGVDKVLPKPFDMRALKRSIAEIQNNRDGGTQVTPPT